MATRKKKSRSSRQILTTILVLLFLFIPSFFLINILLPQTSLPTHEKTVASRVPIPQQGAYLGVSLFSADSDELRVLETNVQKKFAIVGIYVPWGAKNHQFDKVFAESVRKNGKVPLITWEPWEPVSGFDRSEDKVYQEKYLLKHITQGVYDSYIHSFAKDVKEYGGYLMIRFAHEMNGNWYSWGSTFNTPEEYVTAWRHVHDIFEEEQATNATWVWSPNEIYEEEKVPYAHQIELFYPGDAYVDWVGFSAFNWAGLYKNNPTLDPSDIFTATTEKLRVFGKPIMITETATAETAAPQQKARWIGLLAEFMKQNPDIKGVVWFNVEDNGIDWRIDTTPQALEAYTTAFDDYFIQHLDE